MTDAALEILRVVDSMLEEATIKYEVGKNVQANGGRMNALFAVQSAAREICAKEIRMYGDGGGQTIKCPICEEPYTFYSYYAGDQSACPKCRRKAAKNR